MKNQIANLTICLPGLGLQGSHQCNTYQGKGDPRIDQAIVDTFSLHSLTVQVEPADRTSP